MNSTVRTIYEADREVFAGDFRAPCVIWPGGVSVITVGAAKESRDMTVPHRYRRWRSSRPHGSQPTRGSSSPILKRLGV